VCAGFVVSVVMPSQNESRGEGALCHVIRKAIKMMRESLYVCV